MVVVAAKHILMIFRPPPPHPPSPRPQQMTGRYIYLRSERVRPCWCNGIDGGTLGAGMMRVPWFVGKSPLQLPGLNWALVAKSNMCVAGDSDGDGDRRAR